MDIICTPLTNVHTLACPACGTPVFLAHPDHSEVPRGGTWLYDSDTVGGLYTLLSDKQKNPGGFNYHLSVGNCSACCGDYYIVSASFMDAEEEEVFDFLYFNVELGPEHNFLCTLQAPRDGVPQQWLMHQYGTKAGLMHHHIFGPWALEDSAGVIGPYGVCSCGHEGDADPWAHGRRLLLGVWDGLRANTIKGRAGSGLAAG